MAPARRASRDELDCLGHCVEEPRLDLALGGDQLLDDVGLEVQGSAELGVHVIEAELGSTGVAGGVQLGLCSQVGEAHGSDVGQVSTAGQSSEQEMDVSGTSDGTHETRVEDVEGRDGERHRSEVRRYVRRPAT